MGTLAEAATAYRPNPKCPGCSARGAWRDGSSAAEVPRWRCRCCGRRFKSLTGTVLEHCRKPLPVWVSFIRLMSHNAPVECAAELCGVTYKTAFEWRHRALATVSGYQDWIVLRDACGWTRPTSTTPTSQRATGRPQARPALSCQKLCICAPSMSTRTPSRASEATGNPARRA